MSFLAARRARAQPAQRAERLEKCSLLTSGKVLPITQAAHIDSVSTAESHSGTQSVIIQAGAQASDGTVL